MLVQYEYTYQNSELVGTRVPRIYMVSIPPTILGRVARVGSGRIFRYSGTLCFNTGGSGSGKYFAPPGTGRVSKYFSPAGTE